MWNERGEEYEDIVESIIAQRRVCERSEDTEGDVEGGGLYVEEGSETAPGGGGVVESFGDGVGLGAVVCGGG